MADAIVVGGGHNGLTCAAYLARAGLDVLVLEARGTVGGCASTVEALDGARVNICNCDHTLIRASGIVEELDLAAHGLTYLDMEPSLLCLGWDPGQTPWLHFHDVSRTLESIGLAHPDQVDGYRRYLDDMLPAARLLLDVMRTAPTPGRVARTVARHRGRGAAQVLRLSRTSLVGALSAYFTSDALLGPVATTGPAVWGLPPTAPGSGLGALGYALRHVVQTGRPAGGSGALTDALASAARGAGAEIRTGAGVARILCHHGRAHGIELATGERLDAPIVIAATNPRTVLVDWLTEVPPAARRLVARYRAQAVPEGYESKLDAIIDALPRPRALDDDHLSALGVEEPLAPTAVVAPTIAGIERAHADARAGRVAERPLLLANVPSIRDPELAPAGADHVFSLEVLFTPYGLAGGWKESAEPERWLGAYAGLLQDGFLEGVRDFRLMGPEEYERDFGLPGGHAPSYAGGPLAALSRRDRELTRYATPVEGLFLTGAGTFPGAGVSGTPGRNAARAVLTSARSSGR